VSIVPTTLNCVIFGIESQGRHPDLKKYNLVVDISDGVRFSIFATWEW